MTDQQQAGALAAEIGAGAGPSSGVTVATAESLTAGLVAGTIGSVPGASLVLRGGVVAYATDLKATLLGVDAGLLARGGAVQAEVALAMARGVGGAARRGVRRRDDRGGRAGPAGRSAAGHRLRRCPHADRRSGHRPVRRRGPGR